VGYTTDFEGQFHCYHPEGAELRVFLEAIRQGDHASMGPLGDWLLDRGDPRGEKVAHFSKGPVKNRTAFWSLFGLKEEHARYLEAFSDTRRMRRDESKAKLLPDPVREAVGLPLGPEAAYFIGGSGFKGQGEDDSVLDYNRPPRGQPGLWCQWVPAEDRTALMWNGAEKFYSYVEWLEYLLRHFLGPWGYVVNGTVTWQGEEPEDTGTITVTDNRVKAVADPS
jgi:hypothetical protein